MYQSLAQSASVGVVPGVLTSRRLFTHRGRSSPLILVCSAAYTSPYASNARTLSGFLIDRSDSSEVSSFVSGSSSKLHMPSHASHLAYTHSCSAHGVFNNEGPSVFAMRSIAALFASPTLPTAASHLHTRRSSSSSSTVDAPHFSAADMRSATTPELGATRRATMTGDMPCVLRSANSAAGSDDLRKISHAGSEYPAMAAR